LHFAAIQNDHHIVAKILKNSGVDVNLRDSDGFSPVMSAVLFGSLESLKLLLEHRDVAIDAEDLTRILAKFDENRHDSDLDQGKMMMCIKLYREAFVTRKRKIQDEKDEEAKKFSKIVDSENNGDLGEKRKRAVSLFSPKRTNHASISEEDEDLDGVESVISSSSSEGSTKSLPMTNFDFATIKPTKLRRSKTIGPSTPCKRAYSLDSFPAAPTSLIISNFPLVTLSLSTSEPESTSENHSTIPRSSVSSSAIKMMPIQEADNTFVDYGDDDVFEADPKDEKLVEINKLEEAIKVTNKQKDHLKLKQSQEQKILTQKKKRLDDFKINNEKRLEKLTMEKNALLDWLQKINNEERSLVEENSGINFQLCKLNERRAINETSLEKERKYINNKHTTLLEQHRKLSESIESHTEERMI